MLISFSRRFLFVHVYKAAGTSIRAALEPFAHNPDKTYPNRLARAIGQDISWPFLKSKKFHQHSTAAELRDLIPVSIFEQFFKFAFVRNPWDWQVSLYHYAYQDATHHQHRLVRSLGDFPSYLDWRVHADRQLQSDFLLDEQGRLLVDFVGRFEEIDSDFSAICRHLGLRAALPRLNQSRHDDYRRYYNERTRRLVAEHFRDDIERFGYTFDDCAEQHAYRQAA